MWGERGPPQQSHSCAWAWGDGGDGQEVLGSFCGCVLALASLAGQGWVLCAPRVSVSPCSLVLAGLINVGLVNKASSWGIPFISSRGEQVCSAFFWMLRSHQCDIFPKEKRKNVPSLSLQECGFLLDSQFCCCLGAEVGMRVERQLRSSQAGCPRRWCGHMPGKLRLEGGGVCGFSEHRNSSEGLGPY